MNPSAPSTTNDEPNDEKTGGRTLGYAAVLAREDVTDPSDPRVRERIEDHQQWADQQRRRARARREGRDGLRLDDFEDAGRAE